MSDKPDAQLEPLHEKIVSEFTKALSEHEAAGEQFAAAVGALLSNRGAPKRDEIVVAARAAFCPPRGEES